MEPKELIAKLSEKHGSSIVESEKALKTARAEIGAGEADVQAAIEELGELPIDGATLEAVAVGVPLHWSTKPFDPTLI